MMVLLVLMVLLVFTCELADQVRDGVRHLLFSQSLHVLGLVTSYPTTEHMAVPEDRTGPGREGGERVSAEIRTVEYRSTTLYEQDPHIPYSTITAWV